MKNVIEKLKQYNSKINLSERFLSAGFDITDEIFNFSEKEVLSKGINSFEKNILLKQILHKKYNENKSNNDLDFWVINSWGGIRGFKKTEQNITKLNKFKHQILTNKLTLDTFSTISSLSKVASFINPNEFVIYDSRVIYSLNWLILTSENQENFNVKYFPIPTGRNKIISDFDMNTILNLSHLTEYESNKKIFYNHQEAYHRYCDFIKQNHLTICGINSKPFELELLLFTLADKEIFEEIKSSFHLNMVSQC